MFFIPQDIINLVQKIKKYNYEVYIVGGYVRDNLLGKESNDIDLTTGATPEELKEILSNDYIIVETGIKHGTITVVTEKSRNVEVTTFRNETTYSDNRHPDKINYVRTYQEDSKRRDFTINAIYLDPITLELKDPQNGLSDLRNKIIRCIGNSNDRFDEDSLRILRAVRFLTTLPSFTLHEETHKAVLRKKDLLRNISIERIRDELLKMIMSNHLERVIYKYFSIITMFIPELHKCKNFDQNSRSHEYDCLTHIVKACDYAFQDPVIKLSALFHDISKPLCETKAKRGSHSTYPNHEGLSAAIAYKRLKYLKFDNKTCSRVSNLVAYHDLPLSATKINQIKVAILKVGLANIQDLIELKRADFLAHGTNHFKENQFYELKFDIILAISNIKIKSIKDMDFNGDDLQCLGIMPGPIYSEILNSVFKEVMFDNIPNNKHDIANYIKTKLLFDINNSENNIEVDNLKSIVTKQNKQTIHNKKQTNKPSSTYVKRERQIRKFAPKITEKHSEEF